MIFVGCRLPLRLIAETNSLEIAMSKKQSIRKLKICNNNRGFTLIEIMIAMVIFVVGMLSVAAMQTSATKGNNTANRSTRAFTWCSDRMEVLMGLPYNDPEFSCRRAFERRRRAKLSPRRRTGLTTTMTDK